MEIGRIAEMDNAKLNNIEKVQKIHSADENNKIRQNEEYKKALGNKEESPKNEVILDNVRFGYNTESKDFFVKITRGSMERKYPTEDMMRVKAYMLQEIEVIKNKH